AYTGRHLGGWHDMHFDNGHFIDAQRHVVVKVGLLDDAFFQRDGAVQRRRQSVSDPAFHLRAYHIRIDRDTAIHRAYHAVDAERSILLYRDLGHLRDEGLERLVHGDPPAAALSG